MQFTHQLHRSSVKLLVLDFKPLLPELPELGTKFFFNVGPEWLLASSFNLFPTSASIMKLLLILEPLVEAIFGNAKFFAISVFVAAVLVVELENLELPLSRVRSEFAYWQSKRVFTGLLGLKKNSCKSSSRSRSHASRSELIHTWILGGNYARE